MCKCAAIYVKLCGEKATRILLDLLIVSVLICDAMAAYGICSYRKVAQGLCF